MTGEASNTSLRATTDGLPPRPGYEAGPAPAPIDPRSGQHEAYWILSEEERAKGFVRPVRRSYRHVGLPGPTYPLRDLTDDEQRDHAGFGYVKFEAYPEGDWPITGKFWTSERLASVGRGCGAVTTMGSAIAETYARDPRYYGATFCATCRQHLRVGAQGEFVWLDEHGRDTTERVGT